MIGHFNLSLTPIRYQVLTVSPAGSISRATMNLDKPPRRDTLRPESTSNGTDTDIVADVALILKTRRHRAPRTYARKRPRAQVSAQLDTRSATVSLETRNCGEGRISLGTKAVPLPMLAGGGGDDDSFDVEYSSGEDSDTYSSRRRRPARKRRGATSTKIEEPNDERTKLNEFLAQQKAFWEEVDDSSLVEEEEKEI